MKSSTNLFAVPWLGSAGRWVAGLAWGAAGRGGVRGGCVRRGAGGRGGGGVWAARGGGGGRRGGGVRRGLARAGGGGLGCGVLLPHSLLSGQDRRLGGEGLGGRLGGEVE